ncbi:MAG TPA: PRC-barrel domain-containing protein [Ignavibacteriales bacterium]|nr:PRC-barrel domain-containing protein [Ignavibacteriales bacterium]
MKNYHLLSSSTITGDDVKNTMGEDLGKIEEIMIDVNSGRIAYVVLSFGGFLGIGDKYFAIPWESLRLSTEEHAFYLDVPKEKLENAPGFDKDNWPDNPDQQFVSDIYSYYGYRPYWDIE